MTDFKKYISNLVNFGYDNKENISDFWFSHKAEIVPKLFKQSGNSDLFSLVIRWESEIGKECSKAVKQFIKYKQDKTTETKNKLYQQGIVSSDKAEIDFNKFTLNYKNEEYSLQSFANLFPTSQVFGRADLRGINLNNIKINSSIIKNAFLSESDFSNAILQQIELINVNFVNANFLNARLALIKLDNNSTFGNANFSNAFLNAITLTDKALGDGIEINEISYLTLLMKSFTTKYTDKRNHTEFSSTDTKEILDYKLQSLKKYIEWYMTVTTKIRSAKNNWRKRLSVTFQIFISKYWSSYTVFGAITLLIILLFSAIFYSSSSNFKFSPELKPIDFFDSIYFVVVTFTTLGYGDISPINWHGQFFVIITALTGYLFLGIFIYLLSKKIEMN